MSAPAPDFAPLHSGYDLRQGIGGAISQRRPREGGDPYAAVSRFGSEPDELLPNGRRWRWVPAQGRDDAKSAFAPTSSYPANAGYPVHRGLSIQSLTSLEYQVARS